MHAHGRRLAIGIMQFANISQLSARLKCTLECNRRLLLLLNINNLYKPSKLLISLQILYIVLIVSLANNSYTVNCLQTSTIPGPTKSTNVAILAAQTTGRPTLMPNDTTSNVNELSTTSAELLLLSGEDFVDSREVPSILFDGTSNNDEPVTITPATTPLPPNREKQKDYNSTITQVDGTNSSQILSPSAKIDSSRVGVDYLNNNQSAPIEVSNNIITAKPRTGLNDKKAANEEEEEEDEGGKENDAEENDTDQGNRDSILNEGIYEKAFEPPQNISQYMDYIEKLFHDLRHQITDLFEPHLPQLIRTSQMVDLSSSCSYDMLRMALALRQFEPWALRMIDSSGKVPEGIFEGTFTALGSYDECLNTVFTRSSGQLSVQSANNNEHESATELGNKLDRPTQGQYCLVTVSPFMPPKPPADKVDCLFQEEANRRNYTRDDQFSRLSPMFYYMKFRIGVCIPSSCHQQDMSSIADALSSSLRLNISIPDCRVRRPEGEPLTSHQLAGGLVFGLVCTIVLAATLLDCFKLKWKQIRSQERELVVAGANGACADCQSQKSIQNTSPVVASHPGGDQERPPQPQPQPGCGFMIKMVHTLNGHTPEWSGENGKSLLSGRLGKHWSWMSFSLLANFQLYFMPKESGREQTARIEQQLPNTTRANCQIISCLNGIRVLSLCWVIVANSYLTLDPRATKRLTKTREAPRDFLFQVVVQASLAIETFFFLSGLLMSLSFVRQLRPTTGEPNRVLHNDGQDNSTDKRRYLNNLDMLKWFRFYVHRYVRMTPPTMLVIAVSMYAYHYGDGPLWFEATQRVHQSCSQNWWRHMLHVANFIDTRQMCFIHYWYIAADMQLFLFAPILLLILHKSRTLGYLLCALIGSLSIGSVFYITYERNLPPTLLFYSTDPESRREFGNSIMTKPFAHALPYLVGMLVGWCFVATSRGGGGGCNKSSVESGQPVNVHRLVARRQQDKTVDASQAVADGRASSLAPLRWWASQKSFSLTGLFGTLALAIALVELFLPYKWNNSHLPSRLCSALYAALFRFGWSLVLAFIVISCRHTPTRHCLSSSLSTASTASTANATANANTNCRKHTPDNCDQKNLIQLWCFCGAGGNLLNRLLGLNVFSHLSKLSFVAYLVHLPLMSVFIGQTRGLFAFSHTLVIHFAISYLVMSFALSFVLAHIIEFPFVTFEGLLFDKLQKYVGGENLTGNDNDNEHKYHGANQKKAPIELSFEMNNKQSGVNGVNFISNTDQIHRITGGNVGNTHGRDNLATYKL